MKKLNPFHLAFPVNDIEKAKQWYIDVLGCNIGRESTRWVDFNFFGHQISAHLVENTISIQQINSVDNKDIPVRHFGIILNDSEWKKLANKFAKINLDFLVSPYTRFEGEIGEQSTMFIKDPSGNVIEFKSFKNNNNIFSN
ncbi:MAG: glyoxalase [bacterium TMED6]|nr:MAG: glyoxalase [bacterium TMED6]